MTLYRTNHLTKAITFLLLYAGVCVLVQKNPEIVRMHHDNLERIRLISYQRRKEMIKAKNYETKKSKGSSTVPMVIGGRF